MKRYPYPEECETAEQWKDELQEMALRMARLGGYQNAAAIRKRLYELQYHILLHEFISEEHDPDFFDRLNSVCAVYYTGEIT